MATAGKILMFPVGNWTSGNNYGFLDIVYYGGSSYIAKTDITNSTTNPATDTTNWQILAHGYIADTLSGIDGVDTSGLLGTVGATVTGQALLDEIADRVATKLVLKTAISNQQVNDTTKVTGSALAYSMGQSIDTLNSNLMAGTAIIPAGDGGVLVTYGRTLSAAPKIILTPRGSAPDVVISPKAKDISTTGFGIVVVESTASGIKVPNYAVSVDWFAIVK